MKVSVERGVPSMSKVGYLPCINASPTELKTVNEVFKRSIAIADELKQEVIVLVMDWAFYAKAQQVRLHEALYEERTLIRLGEFHTCMSFLGVIGKRFARSTRKCHNV